MHIRFLGTASGYPATDRFGETVVVTIEDEQEGSGYYLLDVGDGASSLLQRYGYDHTAIRAIVISHMHADHHGGFAQVVKTCMHRKRTDDLVVLAPQEGIAALQTYLEASYLTEALLGYSIQWIPLPDVVQTAVVVPGQVTIRAHANDHLAYARQRMSEWGIDNHGYSFESYSVAVGWNDLRIVYSGNLNGPRGADELIPILEPAHALVCELAHVDPTELGRMLAGRRVDKVLLAHFHPKWADTSDAELMTMIEAGAADKGELGEIVFATDGSAFDIAQTKVG